MKHHHPPTQEEEVKLKCNHCRGLSLYTLKFHYGNRPKKVNGHYTIPLEMEEYKIYENQLPALCSSCTQIPKCKGCRIILCDIKSHHNAKPHPMNANYCESCFNYEFGVIPNNGGLQNIEIMV